tara:strand:- start:139 stop:720 length:582 start_codon:yes stop_codon:yes gene_type:complete
MENNMTDNQILKPNMPNLNDEVATDIAKFSRNKVTSDKLEHNMVATMKAAGFIHTDCISPTSKGSTATKETFDFLKSAIAAGFPKGVKELCDMSPKAAGDKLVDGRNRSYWSKQPNSLVAAVGKALRIQAEIDAEIAAGNASPNQKTRTAEMIVRDKLKECVTKIQKTENFTCKMDADDMILALNALIKKFGK